MAELQAMTALGGHQPVVMRVGPILLTERFDLALASVAARQGKDLAGAANMAGVPLPEAGRHQAGTPYSAFWVGPGMWFLQAPVASHELIAARLKAALGDTASVTEQTDAWVIFDISAPDILAPDVAPDIAPLLERLCNVDFRASPDGYATRTMVEHLGCYLIRLGPGAARLYGPRSSARSLLHALEVAAASAF